MLDYEFGYYKVTYRKSDAERNSSRVFCSEERALGFAKRQYHNGCTVQMDKVCHLVSYEFE